MSRVLLTGATGFVGGRTASRLIATGHDVIAPVRRESAELTRLGVDQHLGGLDAVDPGLLTDIDVVVHAAATAGGDLAAAAAVNVDGTRRLWDASRTAGTPRFVHVSTTSVYATPGEDVDVIAEDSTLVASDDEAAAPYARTKADGERLLLATHDGPATVILRPPAVLGAGPTSTWGTRIPTAIAEGRGFDAPRQRTFAFVHVDDLVDAITVVADLDEATSPDEGRRPTGRVAVANVVGGHVTVADYLDAVLALLPDPVTARPGTQGSGWTGRYTTDRLSRLFGVAPHRSFRTGMAEIADAWAAGHNEQEDGT